jgi:hypothetical protein
MSVREIVERAGVRLPSKSKTPDTVVARDLSMDIKKKGEGSLFIRTSPGRYTLRVLATGTAPIATIAAATNNSAPQPMSALAQRKPAVAAPSTVRPAAATGRPDTADGGGYAS